MDSKTINILGTDYRINFVDKFPEHMSEFEDNADGLFNGLNREIFIHTRNYQQDLTGITEMLEEMNRTIEGETEETPRKAPKVPQDHQKKSTSTK